jgi:hypothetical protein
MHVVPSPAAETATSPAGGRGDVDATTLAFCINHNPFSFRHFHPPTPALVPEKRSLGGRTDGFHGAPRLHSHDASVVEYTPLAPGRILGARKPGHLGTHLE